MKHRWQAYLPEAATPAPVASKQQAVRSQTRESDVDVPLRLAIYSGLLILFALATFAGAIGGLAWMRARLGWAILILAAMVIVWVAVLGLWFRLLFENRSMLWQIEDRYNVDLDKDGHVGKPAIIRLERSEIDGEGYERLRYDNIPISQKRGQAGLIVFARAIVNSGESFAERQAADYGGYSREEWESLRDYFLHDDRQWATWNHPTSAQQGISLTVEGLEIMDGIARNGLPRL